MGPMWLIFTLFQINLDHCMGLPGQKLLVQEPRKSNISIVSEVREMTRRKNEAERMATLIKIVSVILHSVQGIF